MISPTMLPFEHLGGAAFNPALFRNFTPEISDMLRLTSQLLDKLANVYEGGFGNPFDSIGFQDPKKPFPVPLEPPSFIDSSQPPGSLRTEGNTVTTAGGYKITQEGQFNWRITGPDGKNTFIHGDPHVAEGDGGKWDFKRNSTFVLGDGTRINVTTAPYSQNKEMTVTQKLEIISGNDRVEVTGIDEGTGKVGTVTQDGYAHANSFAGKDVFVMGRETDDWSLTGREVIGSENGGDTFKLGGQLEALRNSKPEDFARTMLDMISNSLRGDFRPSPFERANPFQSIRYDDYRNGGSNYDRQRAMLGDMLRLMGRMLKMMARMFEMNDQIQIRRSPMYRIMA